MSVTCVAASVPYLPVCIWDGDNDGKFWATDPSDAVTLGYPMPSASVSASVAFRGNKLLAPCTDVSMKMLRYFLGEKDPDSTFTMSAMLKQLLVAKSQQTGVCAVHPDALAAVMISHDMYVPARAEAVSDLTHLGAWNYLPQLQEMLSPVISEPLPVLVNVVYALASSKEHNSFLALRSTLEDPATPQSVKRAIIDGLGYFFGTTSDGRSVPRILSNTLTYDESSYIRSRAATELIFLATCQEVPALDGAAKQDQDPVVRDIARFAVKRINDNTDCPRFVF